MKIKWIVVLISSVILCSCSSTEYYYTLKGKKKFTHTGLYNSTELTVYLDIYDTKESRVSIYFEGDTNKKPQSFKILEYKHWIIDGEEKHRLSLVSERESVDTPSGEMMELISGYVFENKNPKKLVESIFLKLSIHGRVITISEDIKLKKDSYGRLAEIWAI